MKYIIEIEDQPFVRQSTLYGEQGLYRAKGFRSLVFDENGLKKLETAPTYDDIQNSIENARAEGFEEGINVAGRDTWDYAAGFSAGMDTDAYQQGLNDAWEAARMITDLSTDPVKRESVIGGYAPNFFIRTKSAHEAIETLRQWEQKKNEIQVGDEVDGTCGRGIVTYNEEDGMYQVLWINGKCGIHGKSTLTKTGRHFDAVAELLKQMATLDKEDFPFPEVMKK